MSTVLLCEDVVRPDIAAATREQARRCGARLVTVSPTVFATLSDRDAPTGLAAIVAIPERSLHDIRQGTVVALDRISNPGNLGTIVRTADAAGAAGVVLLDGGADPYAPAAVKASMGSLFSMPVVSATSDEFRAWTSERELPVVATSGYATRDVWADDLPRPCALLMGNEGDGLPHHWLDAAAATVAIPMVGKAESLNVAVATGICLYEIQRPALRARHRQIG